MVFVRCFSLCFSLLSLSILHSSQDGQGLEDAFSSVHGKVATVFTWIRNILFLVAGMALIAVAASAYAGRFNIKWFVTVLVSVVLIAINGALTDYFVDTSITDMGDASQGIMDDAIRSIE